jgi:hypothetical protein
VETIAGRGYTSEFAFNRAFSRHRGQPPGRYRRLARADGSLVPVGQFGGVPETIAGPAAG